MNAFKVGIALCAALLLSGCSDPTAATKALTGAGYTQIQITGHSWFGCGKDDSYSTGFEAKGPTGVPVKGAVCSGLFFKNSTIRTE